MQDHRSGWPQHPIQNSQDFYSCSFVRGTEGETGNLFNEVIIVLFNVSSAPWSLPPTDKPQLIFRYLFFGQHTFPKPNQFSFRSRVFVTIGPVMNLLFVKPQFHVNFFNGALLTKPSCHGSDAFGKPSHALCGRLRQGHTVLSSSGSSRSRTSSKSTFRPAARFDAIRSLRVTT